MKTIYQVLTEDRYGIPTLQSWHETEKEANDDLTQCKKFWPESNFWIEEGTEYITTKCRGCGSVYTNEMHDAYGITTGHWCDDCYENNYPYRKDRYDYAGNGERLEDDY